MALNRNISLCLTSINKTFIYKLFCKTHSWVCYPWRLCDKLQHYKLKMKTNRSKRDTFLFKKDKLYVLLNVNDFQIFKLLFLCLFFLFCLLKIWLDNKLPIRYFLFIQITFWAKHYYLLKDFLHNILPINIWIFVLISKKFLKY